MILLHNKTETARSANIFFCEAIGLCRDVMPTCRIWSVSMLFSLRQQQHCFWPTNLHFISLVFIWLLNSHAWRAATMMFCTTFLSAPSEDLGCESGGDKAALADGGLGPGSCLSSLHCLVLPQDELYTSLSEPTTHLSICPKDQTCSLVGKMLFDVGVTTCGTRDGGCIWDKVRRRRSRSASPSPSKSPCSERVKGMC